MHFKADTIRDILLSMGYHEGAPGKWLKPVGYHLFTFSEERSEWANWFKTYHTKELACWDRKKLDPEFTPERFLIELQEWEAYTNISSGWVRPDFRIAIIDICESDEKG